MSRPPPSPPLRSAIEYAERALPASRSSAETLPDAAIQAFEDLHARLRMVFGAAGCEALFRRSLSRAAERHSLLAPAEVERTPEGLVEVLRLHVRPDNAGEVADALRAIMAEQISLLTRFIGENLVGTILQTEPGPRARADDETRADE